MGSAGLTNNNVHSEVWAADNTETANVIWGRHTAMAIVGCGARVPSRAPQSPSLGSSMHLKEKDVIFHMEYSYNPAISPS